ncbi:MAG: SDR family NAD(P)-dependent oxidoreductase [Anaerolineae bacterium]|nr:SDR family NAD(P)-dependent oxidoreductase [Anaerolineae bacterium]
MKEFQNKVAVITGAASGIGRALAERSVQEGMKVVLADIQDEALTETAAILQHKGGTVLCVKTDVSRAEEMEKLAQETLRAFGGVHLLFNNAGVGAGGTIWESTLDEWEWVLGVNLWGVIHGLRLFVPIMMAQDTGSHIVNSASLAGLLPYHPSAPYQVTKQGIVALSEQLYYSLKQWKAPINVSVLCPGAVRTGIMDGMQQTPPEWQSNTAVLEAPSQTKPDYAAALASMRRATAMGMSPKLVAEHVFAAIRDERFYILTHPEFNTAVHARMQSVLLGQNPPDLSRVIGYCLK